MVIRLFFNNYLMGYVVSNFEGFMVVLENSLIIFFIIDF